jgi:hypothetical protein
MDFALASRHWSDQLTIIGSDQVQAGLPAHVIFQSESSECAELHDALLAKESANLALLHLPEPPEFSLLQELAHNGLTDLRMAKPASLNECVERLTDHLIKNGVSPDDPRLPTVLESAQREGEFYQEVTDKREVAFLLEVDDPGIVRTARNYHFDTCYVPHPLFTYLRYFVGEPAQWVQNDRIISRIAPKPLITGGDAPEKSSFFNAAFLRRGSQKGILHRSPPPVGGIKRCYWGFERWD